MRQQSSSRLQPVQSHQPAVMQVPEEPAAQAAQVEVPQSAAPAVQVAPAEQEA